MTPSLALALVAIMTSVAALGMLLVRALAAPSTQVLHALAQLGVVRLKELERSWRGRTDEARIELLRQLLEEARVRRRLAMVEFRAADGACRRRSGCACLVWLYPVVARR